MGPGFEAVGVEGKVVVRENFENGFVVFFGDGAGATKELVGTISISSGKVGKSGIGVPLGMSYKLLTISGRDGRNHRPSFVYASPALLNWLDRLTERRVGQRS